MKRIVILAALAALVCACGPSRKAVNVYRADSVPQAGNDINVGYGSVSQDELTYSVSQVDVEEHQANTYSNIWDYLRGRVPGVSIGYAEGGQTPDIQVRGISSVNSSTQPLIILDGVETQDISFLSPNDVGSVSVLKDAAASIYGTRGANGVILITTKAVLEAAKREAEAKKAERAAQKAARQAKKASKDQ